MRLIAAVWTIFMLALTFGLSARHTAGTVGDEDIRKIREGQQIFRYDTFGDEQLWTAVLRMHEAIATVSPATALAVGLKVDIDALPAGVIEALEAGQVDLNNPAVTNPFFRRKKGVGGVGEVN